MLGDCHIDARRTRLRPRRASRIAFGLWGPPVYSTLYLVRHGQTVFNTRLLIQGRCDSPLTDLGREQARAAALWLGERGVRFDAAFSSPAERACGTMELLWGGAYQRLEGLRERSFGDLEGTDVLALPKPMGDYPVPFGGEPESELEERLTSTLAAVMRGAYGEGPDSGPGVAPPGRAIASRNPVPGRTDAPVEPCAVRPFDEGAPRSGNVLAVSHGAACKAFARAWEHTAEVEIPSPFPNCCVLVYRFDGASFTLVEAADPAAHLGGEGLPI